MEYRILGKTGLKISRLGFGGIPIQKIDAEGTKALVADMIKEEQLKLAYDTLSDKNVMYCPHGRPVAFEIKRKELERQFGRIQ